MSDTITRDEAIALYGSHWDAHRADSVTEEIGPADPQFAHLTSSLDDAMVQVGDRARRRTNERVDEIIWRLGIPINRWLILRIRLGLISRAKAESIGKAIAALKAERDGGTEALASEHFPVEVVRLPDTFRVPHMLKIRQPVWIVDFAWPLSDGVSLSAANIDGIEVYDGRRWSSGKSKPYDLDIHYSCDAGRYGFTYPHDDAEIAEVKVNIHGRRLFLSEAAARACIQSVADELSSAAEAARKL